MGTDLHVNLHNQLIVYPSGPLHGNINQRSGTSFPGDKSLSHRASLFAALADGTSYVENFLISGVTHAMLDALTDLGISWNLSGDTLTVQGIGLRAAPGIQPFYINCGNSGTTMRLLAGALACWNLPAILDGSEGLRRRPMNRIVLPLQKMGVNIYADGGHAPLVMKPVEGLLRSIQYELPVASAQVKSCLLLAGLSADGDTILCEPGPSRDHTERMLASMGAKLIKEQQAGDYPFVTRLLALENRTLSPLRLRLPGDFSAAAFLIVAAIITPGSEITLEGIGLNPTRTGLLDALIRMDADLEVRNQTEQGGEPVGDLIIRHSHLKGIQVQGELVVRMIDEFPALAVAAAFAEGVTVVKEAEELRYKESDRISALCAQLSTIGVHVDETTDGFIIHGGTSVRGGEIDPHGDHRLAMSLSVAGLAAEKAITVRNAGIINESFPSFVNILTELGANIVVE